MKRIEFAALAVTLMTSWPVLASEGCNAFHGTVDDQTTGEGGTRASAGFSKGDTLTVTIHQAPDQMKEDVNLLEYASPDGPFRALTEGRSDSFSYTVPSSTGDFIDLNFSGALPGMTVTWSCTPAK